MSEPFSLRFQTTLIDRLSRRAAACGTQPRTLAQRYVEEGLRRDEHPQIWFVDGPSGRRAALVGTGPDVWEAIATVRDNDNDVAAAAEYLQIPIGKVEAAIGYYGAFQAEVDMQIATNEEESRRGVEAFLAGQRALDR